MSRSSKNKFVKPFVKWVGGKRQIMSDIVDLLPKDFKNRKYFEPFVGGGAVFFHLQPKDAVINDFNKELINVYSVIKNNLEELIEDLKKHKNNSEYFYEIRAWDRTEKYNSLSEVQKASRVLYLNKTCYNGLYRVNNAGEFNSPYGRYKNPNIVNATTLKAVHKYLNQNKIKIISGDYEDALKEADENSFVYIDPPYHPISESSNFTGYIKGGWNIFDQLRLREVCDNLTEKGVKFLASNSSAPFIKDQYKHYNIVNVKAKRAINSNATKRGEINEVLIRNYE